MSESRKGQGWKNITLNVQRFPFTTLATMEMVTIVSPQREFFWKFSWGIFFPNWPNNLKREMENLQFDQTKASVKFYGLDLAARLNGTIRSISEDKELRTKDSNWTPKEIAGHIYLVNQYLIRKVEKITTLLHEGLLNEESEYLESDLTLVETMLNVSVYKIQSLPEFQLPLPFSLEELELKLAIQLRKLIQLSKEAPAAYANNYLSEMKVIPGIKLDIYQLIYFGLKHAEHHLDQIEALKSIQSALESEVTRRLEQAPVFTYRV